MERGFRGELQRQVEADRESISDEPSSRGDSSRSKEVERSELISFTPNRPCTVQAMLYWKGVREGQICGEMKKGRKNVETDRVDL